MSEELNPSGVLTLLDHWIEHNEKHSESFNEWALKLKDAGYTRVGEEIIRAAENMDQSTECLRRAREEIKT
ncbi:hypothetical protein B6V01_004345 [Methanosarcinales archaeon ex4572_44]|nr:MAG: hypothetical protein B6U67_01185 [Methanosarcinales archaeon ex4484_138]PHP45386.1 MAG: hypothetical protein B6V01_004345 [Methanosarcinales archaeon ex4572_44]RLG25745.1 MAG: hypothetical protein DRN70_03880 [Methanosarcinales archaeon]RLG25876.1 MAG: hypothetical protein DRN85_04635 [Methanosarcinales archaeon]